MLIVLVVGSNFFYFIQSKLQVFLSYIQVWTESNRFFATNEYNYVFFEEFSWKSALAFPSGKSKAHINPLPLALEIRCGIFLEVFVNLQ
jgi:hypothetical protein